MRSIHAARTGGAAALLLVVPSFALSQMVESPFQRKGNDPTPIQRQGFSVVLLLGDTQGPEAQDSVPAAARRALADMKDFLPYKSYRLLDTQWTLCCSNSPSAITRLRGLEDREYELELRPIVESTGRLSVRFVLRELEGASKGKLDADGEKRTTMAEMEGRLERLHEEKERLQRSHTQNHPSVLKVNAEINRVTGILNRWRVESENAIAHAMAFAEADRQLQAANEELFRLEREQADLNVVVSKGKTQVERGTKDPLEVLRAQHQLAAVNQRIGTLKDTIASSPQSKFGMRPVIDTSFRMDVGETVVVGTSRLKGGTTALIALLTAVPKSK
jgi:hypothetical protein